MLKLDTHSIQMIAICTILLSTIFLGYLEFKRLHYKLDNIADNLKTIEDLKTINNKSKLQNIQPIMNKSTIKKPMPPTSMNPSNPSINEENIVNKIFSNQSSHNINIDSVPYMNGTGMVESYDQLDKNDIIELDNISHVDNLTHVATVDDTVDDTVDYTVDDTVDYTVDGVDEYDVDKDEDVDDVDDSVDGDNITMEVTLNSELNSQLNDKKLKELRAILKERNLAVTGNKQECINRIVVDITNNSSK